MNEGTALNMKTGSLEHATSEACWGVIKGNTGEKCSIKSQRYIVCRERTEAGKNKVEDTEFE